MTTHDVEEQLGSFVPPAIGHPEADQAEFMRKFEADLKARPAEFTKVSTVQVGAVGDGVRGMFDYTDIANRAQLITGRSVWPSTVKAILELATLPKITEAELVGVMQKARFSNSIDMLAGRVQTTAEADKQTAQAILARFPQIVGV